MTASLHVDPREMVLGARESGGGVEDSPVLPRYRNVDCRLSSESRFEHFGEPGRQVGLASARSRRS